MKTERTPICIWKQVIDEERRHNASVRGYLRAGCLNCSGYLDSCNNYIPYRNEIQKQSYLQEEDE